MSFSYTHKVMLMSFCHIFLRFCSHHHDSQHHKTVKKCGDRLSQNMVLLQYFSLSFCSSISLYTIFSGTPLKVCIQWKSGTIQFASCVCKQELWSQLTATGYIGNFYDERLALYRIWVFAFATNGLCLPKNALFCWWFFLVTVVVVEKVPLLLERKPISNTLCISSTETGTFSWWHHRFDISILMASWVAA